jgi:hypothetical protein
MDVTSNSQVKDRDVTTIEHRSESWSAHDQLDQGRGTVRSLISRFGRVSQRAEKRSEKGGLAGAAELQRRLSWCRRYEEPAELLVARMPALAPRRRSTVIAVFRVSDSVALGRAAGEYELRAMLLDRDLDRAAVERRVAEASGQGVSLGWARFPEDGVTLDTLVDVARKRLRSSSKSRWPAEVATRNSRLRTVARVGEEKYADA